jgi:murein DD-endopeptidase MepM/ murein hydrolase activator NlpD
VHKYATAAGSLQDASSNSSFTRRWDRLYAQEVKINSWVPFVLLLLSFSPGSAQQSPGFQAISWSPQHLESGSPVFFKVELDQPASALHGTWLKHDVVFTKGRDGNSWYALAGIDVEQAPGTYALELTATATDGHPLSTRQEVTVLAAHYKTTTLHVEEKYVQPDAATLQRIAADKAVKDAAFAHLTSEPLWNGSFRSPVPFTATDSFGTRRMFNGELASVHRGTDFHAPSGTPVLAANDGQVIIAQPMFYEGNLVVIDHGQQFTTLYMHLSKIEVKVGDRVRKGQRLGLSGATGRVTGPHLHLSARWQGQWVDPVLLLHLSLPTR